ncbi:MAG: hypothetical protein AAF830_17195 [Pseudomonadota bacterium]
MTDLRLSAMRAFLGQITPSMRWITCVMNGSVIIVSVVIGREPTEEEIERMSVAATEIVSDFPLAKMILEVITVSQDDLPKESIIREE